MSHLPHTGRRHSARFASLPEEDETGGGFEDEPLNDPTPPRQPPRPSLTQHQPQQQRYSDGPVDYAYEQQEYSLNTPYDSPQIPRDRRFSHSATHLQQQRYEDDPASAPAAAPAGLGVVGQQNVQYDYFATTRARGYSHARTMSGSSATGMMTPSPYEYPHNNNSPPEHGVGQRGFRQPIYDEPLPNYKPTALRRPFLVVLLVVIAGITAGLVVGLLKLPVSKGGLVARAVDSVEVENGHGALSVTPANNPPNAAPSDMPITTPDANNPVVHTTSDRGTDGHGNDMATITPTTVQGIEGGTGVPNAGDFGDLSVQETVQITPTLPSPPITTPQDGDGNNQQLPTPTTSINTGPVPGDGDFGGLSGQDTITPTPKPAPSTAGNGNDGQNTLTTSINTGPVPGDDDFGNLNGADPTITGVPPSDSFGNLNGEDPPAITTRPAVTGDAFGDLNGANPTPITQPGAAPPEAFGNLHDDDETAPAVVLGDQGPTHTPIAPGDPPPQAFGGLNNEETFAVTGIGGPRPSDTGGGVGSAQGTAFANLNDDDPDMPPQGSGDQDQEPTYTRPKGVTGDPPPTAFAQLNENEPSGTSTAEEGETPGTSSPTDSETPPPHTTQQVQSSQFQDPFTDPSTTVPYVDPSDIESLNGPPTTVGYVQSSAFNNLGPDPTPDSGVHPTRTATTYYTIPQGSFGVLNPTDTIATTSKPTITYGTASAVILTNAAGSPTWTSTITPKVLLTPHITVITNSQGQLTTVTTDKPIPPSTHILTNAAGTPTKTIVDYPMLPINTAPAAGSPDSNSFVVISSTTTVASYILGMFVPTIVAIILSIPIRILETNARVFHPWHLLSQPQGSLGRRSICLEPFGWGGYLEVFRVLGSGQWLLLATTTLTIFSAVLIPLSAEAIRINLQGPNCKPGTMTNKGCHFITTAFTTPTYVCIGILGVMALILLVLSFTMGRWKTGVACNPWSIGSVASMSLNEEVRRLFAALPTGIDVSDKASEHILESVLQDRRFRLGYFYGRDSGMIEYGIVLADRDRESISEKHAVSGGHGEEVDEYYNDYLLQKFDSQPHFKYNQHHQEPIQELDSQRHLPFLMLGYWGRGLLLFVLLGMIALIGYYTSTSEKTEFEKFMSGEGFGVRFLFTGVGVVIIFAWASFFDSIAIISPFRLQAHHPRPAQKSILLAPPRNAFSGFWAGLRRGDLLLCLTSLIAILTEFLPIMLCNTPFRSTQLYIINRACTYGSLGILAAMSLVLIGSFAVKWPHMPLDPSTVSGMMYYVADSWMLSGFEGGVGRLRRKERDMRIKGLGRSYGFGKGVGVSGRTRVQVDWADQAREPVYL